MKKIILLTIIGFALFGPKPAQAGVLQYWGVESLGAISDFTNAAQGTLTIVSSTTHSGNYSMRMNPITSATGYIVGNGILPSGQVSASANSVTDMYRSGWLRVETFPAVGSENISRAIDTASNAKGFLDITYSRQIKLKNGGAAAVATSSTILTPGTWYHICWALGTAASNPTYNVWINGNLEMSGVGGFGAVNNGGTEWGKRLNTNSQTVDFYWDDMVVRDDRCEDQTAEIKVLIPNASGSYTGWTAGTGSTFTQVDEIPHDGNTTRLETSTNGAKFAANVTDLSTAGITGTIEAIKNSAMVTESAGTAGTQFQLLTISGATEATTTDADIAASYAPLHQMFITDPNTGAAWTNAAIDAVQAGVICVNRLTNLCRTTQILVHVLYVPAVAAPSSPSVLRRMYLQSKMILMGKLILR